VRVAVVTPFHDARSGWLAQCHASVRAQTHACRHLLVADGAGLAPPAAFDGQFLQLGHAHADYGDTPRAAGSLSAVAQGFEAIAYLDGDDWLQPDHVAGLVELHRRTGCAAAYSGVTFCDTAGAALGGSSGFPLRSAYACCLVAGPALRLLALWALMPPRFHVIGDRWMYERFRAGGLQVAEHAAESYCYRTRWGDHYRHFGRPLPPDAKPAAHAREVNARVAELPAFFARRAAARQPSS